MLKLSLVVGWYPFLRQCMSVGKNISIQLNMQVPVASSPFRPLCNIDIINVF